VLAIVALAAATALVYRCASTWRPGERVRVLLPAFALTGLLFMLFSKKSYAAYEIFFMYPVIAVAAGPLVRDWALGSGLLLFNVRLRCEPRLWFRLGGNGKPLSAWGHLAQMPVLAGFVALELVLIACYVYLGAMSVRSLRQTVAGATRSSIDSHSASAC